MNQNNKFPSGISKYGYRMYGRRHMLYIDFFEDSIGGNSPAETDTKSERNLDYNMDNPYNTMYEAFGYVIIKIEDIITHKTLDRIGPNIVGIIHEPATGGYINYYTTYEASINNQLPLDMYKYLYPSGITEYRSIYGGDGTLSEEYFHINGLIQGEKKCYYDNSISSIESYIDGKLHGISKYYYLSDCGKLFRELYSVNGLEYGEEKIFSKKGKLLFTNYYKNGFYDGLVREYSYNGKLESITTYKNGKLDGICIELLNPREKKISYYKNGKKHGISTIYQYDRVSGKKYKFCMQYENGNKQGFTYLYIDNKIIALNKYINNKIIGLSFDFKRSSDIFNDDNDVYNKNKYYVPNKYILNYDGKYSENLNENLNQNLNVNLNECQDECLYYSYDNTKRMKCRLEIERLFNYSIKSIKNIFKIHYDFMTEDDIINIIKQKLNMSYCTTDYIDEFYDFLVSYQNLSLYDKLYNYYYDYNFYISLN